MTDLPAAAVTAAARVLGAKHGCAPEAHMRDAREVLEAAAPHLTAAAAAAERQRLRALIPYNVNCCDGFPAAVADILGEHEDTP